MAVDRPGDYVGNHGGAYTDNSGMAKQFTYVDHDVKTKISGFLGIDKKQIQKDLSEYKQSLIERITSVSASLCPYDFDTFIIRGKTIEWNTTVLNDAGMSVDRLRNLCTLLENKNNTVH